MRSRWPLGSIIKGGTKDLEHLHFPYSWPASLTRLLQRLSQDEESGNRGRAGQDRRLMVMEVFSDLFISSIWKARTEM